MRGDAVEYEVRLVPFEDRKPIAVFQLERIAESGAEVTLDALDEADLLALVAIEDDEERLDGLAYLIAGTERAMLRFAWTRPGTPMEARQQALEALDAWAQAHGCSEIVAYTSKPAKQVQKWAAKYGFELSPKREIVRRVTPKEEPHG